MTEENPTTNEEEDHPFDYQCPLCLYKYTSGEVPKWYDDSHFKEHFDEELAKLRNMPPLFASGEVGGLAVMEQIVKFGKAHDLLYSPGQRWTRIEKPKKREKDKS